MTQQNKKIAIKTANETIVKETEKETKTIVELHHETHYHFDRLTTIMPHELRLRPAPHSLIPIQSYSLKVLPEKHTIHWQQDPFSNYVARLFFPEKTNTLSFIVNIKAELIDINPFDFFIDDYAANYPFQYKAQLKKNLNPFLSKSDKGPLFKEWLENINTKQQGTIDFLIMMNQSVHQLISYTIRHEPGVQSCEETLASKVGSCRDSAWLLAQALRHKGIATRFVSGYQIQLDEEDNSSELHAWVEAFIPGAGWIGLDPSAGLFATGNYIPLACTPEPESAAPVIGNTGPCEVNFEYSNSIRRL